MEPTSLDGILFFSNRYEDEEGNRELKLRIIDDKNIPKPTLAERRLVLRSKGVKLHKIRTAIFFFGDLIKLATSKSWFIDSQGFVFKYVKNTVAKLSFRKIIKKIPIATGGALLEVEGVPNRLKTLYAPTDNEMYAGILLLPLQYILYGVYDKKYKDTWRNI